MKACCLYYQNLKTELKNHVTIKNYGSLKMVFRLSIFAQKMLTSANLWEPLNKLVYFFQRFSWCTTTAPNFLFLTYPCPEICAGAKVTSPYAYTDPKKHGPNRVMIIRFLLYFLISLL